MKKFKTGPDIPNAPKKKGAPFKPFKAPKAGGGVGRGSKGKMSY